jgi:hypothetical protein
MRRTIALTLAAASVGLTACGGSSFTNPPRPPAGNQYEPRVQVTLVKACELSAAGASNLRGKCECVLHYLEARVSQKTLQDTERALVKGEIKTPQWLRDAGTACKGA